MGDSITVQCSILSGDLPISFAWFLNGSPLASENNINIGAFGKKATVLGIDSLLENHAGNYTCVAQNNAGISSFSVALIVKGNFNVIKLATKMFFQRVLLNNYSSSSNCSF